jgi:hypothetical protein
MKMFAMYYTKNRALETELIEKDVVHEARLKQLFGEKVSIVSCSTRWYKHHRL